MPGESLTNKIRLREADEHDAIEIARLVERTFSDQIASELSAAAQVGYRMFITSSVIRRRLLDGHCGLVAIFDDVYCGYSELCDRRSFGRGFDHLALFFVDKRYQRQGLGRLMLEHLIHMIGSRDEKCAGITVDSSASAIPAYKRLGFFSDSGHRQTSHVFGYPMIKPLKPA